mmetsp:Transcript_14587/g.34588  ORF Transcript_14587/g.34588 Transcript_14587/m.34588 type:complete len:147 (+) Transcript_14587:73-513(+)
MRAELSAEEGATHSDDRNQDRTRQIRSQSEASSPAAQQRSAAARGLRNDSEGLQVSALEWRDECRLMKLQMEAQERRFRTWLSATAILFLVLLTVSLISEEQHIQELQQEEKRLSDLVDAMGQHIFNTTTAAATTTLTTLASGAFV